MIIDDAISEFYVPAGGEGLVLMVQAEQEVLDLAAVEVVAERE